MALGGDRTGELHQFLGDVVGKHQPDKRQAQRGPGDGPEARERNCSFSGSRTISRKFSKMGKYYTTIVPEKGEGFYSTVNVKFDGQIVCRK